MKWSQRRCEPLLKHVSKRDLGGNRDRRIPIYEVDLVLFRVSGDVVAKCRDGQSLHHEPVHSVFGAGGDELRPASAENQVLLARDPVWDVLGYTEAASVVAGHAILLSRVETAWL